MSEQVTIVEERIAVSAEGDDVTVVVEEAPVTVATENDIEVITVYIPGPPGTPGADAGAIIGGSYVHVQEIPTDVWIVEHGLPFRPAGVYVEDTAGNGGIEGDVDYPTSSTLTITFSAAFAGRAYLS